jgi:hypothetical protein
MYNLTELFSAINQVAQAEMDCWDLNIDLGILCYYVYPMKNLWAFYFRDGDFCYISRRGKLFKRNRLSHTGLKYVW